MRGQPPLRAGRGRTGGAGRDRLGARLPAPAGPADAARAARRRPDRLLQPHPVPRLRDLRPASVAAAGGGGPARRRPARASSAGPTPPTSCAPAAGPSAWSPRGPPCGSKNPAARGRSTPPRSRSRSTPRAWPRSPGGTRSASGPRKSGRRWASRAWCCWAWTGSTTPRASCTGCGLRRAGRRGAARPAAGAGPGGEPEPGAGRGRTRRSARRSRGQSAGSTASTGRSGYAPVHYLHQSYPREEMAALYLAADVMLVTPLRDGMNLVAKEYVAARYDEGGALVLSEFTGAADELAGAFLVNPHDIEGLKNAIVRAATATPPPRPGAGCARCESGCVSTTWPAGRPASSTRCAAANPASAADGDRPGQLTVRRPGSGDSAVPCRSSGSGPAGRSGPAETLGTRRGGGGGAGGAGARGAGGAAGAAGWSARCAWSSRMCRVEERLGGVPEPAERAGVAGHVILLLAAGSSPSVTWTCGPGWPG